MPNKKTFILAILIISCVSYISSAGKHTYAQEKPVSILFLGDMMFDRTIRVQINKHGFEYVFGPSTSTIAAYDFTIANLEGPITTFKSKTMLPSGLAKSGFEFTFPTTTAQALKNAGIDMVSLANNHTENFGQNGMNQTREILSKNNIQYFGSPRNNPNFMATSTCVKNVCIGIIGWSEFGYANDQFVFTKIKELRSKVDYLVIFPHWGIEYKTEPNQKQIKLAHSWIDAGADAIIGTHPHVVQSIEDYRGKKIYYSLGNFIFDQYFSFNTTHGIGFSVNLTKTATTSFATYSTIPFSSVGSKVSIPTAEEIKKMNLLD